VKSKTKQTKKRNGIGIEKNQLILILKILFLIFMALLISKFIEIIFLLTVGGLGLLLKCINLLPLLEMPYKWFAFALVGWALLSVCASGFSITWSVIKWATKIISGKDKEKCTKKVSK
jgi:hypothetical protein